MKETNLSKERLKIWNPVKSGFSFDTNLTDGDIRIGLMYLDLWNNSGHKKGIQPSKLVYLYNVHSSQLSRGLGHLVENGYLTKETIGGNRILYCHTAKFTEGTQRRFDRGDVTPSTDSKDGKPLSSSELSSSDYTLSLNSTNSTTYEDSYAESQLSFNQRWIKSKPQIVSRLKELHINKIVVDTVEIHWRTRPAVPLDDVLQILTNMAKARPPVITAKQDGYIINAMENILLQLPFRTIRQKEEKQLQETTRNDKNYTEFIVYKDRIKRICEMLNNDEPVDFEELSKTIPESLINQWLEKNALQVDIDKLWCNRNAKSFFHLVDTKPYVHSNTINMIDACERNHYNIPCIDHLKETILKTE